MVVRNRLKQIRHQLELDRQTEMAMMLGLQQQQYNRYERQEIQPTLETALRIAHQLGKPLEDIFFLDEYPEQ